MAILKVLHLASQFIVNVKIIRTTVSSKLAATCLVETETDTQDNHTTSKVQQTTSPACVKTWTLDCLATVQQFLYISLCVCGMVMKNKCQIDTRQSEVAPT